MADERWTIKGCSVCGFESLVRKVPQGGALDHAVHEKKNPGEFEVETVPLAALSACQEELALTAIPTLKLVESYKCMRDRAETAETARDELARVGHRVLILDDAEPGEVSEAHVAVIGELRAALSSEATKPGWSHIRYRPGCIPPDDAVKPVPAEATKGEVG